MQTAKIRIKNPFRVDVANDLYEKMSGDSDVYEYGIDNQGKIYFAYLNGNIKRFTRSNFIKMARANS